MLSRRIALRGFQSALALIALAGCANSATSSTTNGTSVALTNAVGEAATVVNAFILEVPAVSTVFPNILSATQALLLTNPSKSGTLDQAMALVVQLQNDLKGSISDANGASLLTAVVGYLNQALTAAAPLLTAACSTSAQCAEVQAVYKSIVLAAPLIEMFISNVTPTSPTAQAKVLMHRASAVPSQGQSLMTPEAALATLRARFGK